MCEQQIGLVGKKRVHHVIIVWLHVRRQPHLEETNNFSLHRGELSADFATSQPKNGSASYAKYIQARTNHQSGKHTTQACIVTYVFTATSRWIYIQTERLLRKSHRHCGKFNFHFFSRSHCHTLDSHCMLSTFKYSTMKPSIEKHSLAGFFGRGTVIFLGFPMVA